MKDRKNNEDVFEENDDQEDRDSVVRNHLKNSVSGDENDAGNEEVFRVTTQAEIDGMMTEYRSQKGKRTMPSTSSSKGRNRKEYKM